MSQFCHVLDRQNRLFISNVRRTPYVFVAVVPTYYVTLNLYKVHSTFDVCAVHCSVNIQGAPLKCIIYSLVVFV